MNFLHRVILVSFLLYAIAGWVAVAQKTFPERGTIVAMHVADRSFTTGMYTDPYGKTHGGNSIRVKNPVYRVETETKFYELEGRKKNQLVFGEAVQFRIQKELAYLQRGDKEQKFRVVAVELKPTK
jgi:hypothetical protein